MHIECHYIDGLVQERRNSSALAMELRLSCSPAAAGEDKVGIMISLFSVLAIPLPPDYAPNMHKLDLIWRVTHIKTLFVAVQLQSRYPPHHLQ